MSFVNRRSGVQSPHPAPRLRQRLQVRPAASIARRQACSQASQAFRQISQCVCWPARRAHMARQMRQALAHTSSTCFSRCQVRMCPSGGDLAGGRAQRYAIQVEADASAKVIEPLLAETGIGARVQVRAQSKHASTQAFRTLTPCTGSLRTSGWLPIISSACIRISVPAIATRPAAAACLPPAALVAEIGRAHV